MDDIKPRRFIENDLVQQILPSTSGVVMRTEEGAAGVKFSNIPTLVWIPDHQLRLLRGYEGPQDGSNYEI